MPISDQLVTPAIAAEWLTKNQNNRPVSKMTVAAYVKDMTEGHWIGLGADAIVFSKGGDLINGQHRLIAVVKSGVSVEFAVRTEADPRSFIAMDQGRRRSTSDHSCLNGYRNRTAISSALRFIHAYESGLMKTCGSFEPKLLVRDVETLLSRYPEVEENSAATASYRLIRSGLILGVFTLAARIDRGDAMKFFMRVGSGEGLMPGSAEIALRRQLESESVSLAKTTGVTRAARVIKGWNMFRESKRTGRSWRVIQVSSNEPFPTLK